MKTTDTLGQRSSRGLCRYHSCSITVYHYKYHACFLPISKGIVVVLSEIFTKDTASTNAPLQKHNFENLIENTSFKKIGFDKNF